jgi:tight adherence protein C
MTLVQYGFLALVFAAVFAGAFLMLRLSTRSAVRQRIDDLSAGGMPAEKAPQRASFVENIVKLASPLAKLSLPDDNWESSVLRQRFMNAGFRQANAPVVYFTAKTALALLLPLVMYFTLNRTSVAADTQMLLSYLIMAAGLGYYLPNFLLKHAVSSRQRDILEAFPDALDLMTICVEAGLAIDSALSRVAGEIGLTSPVLSEELTLVTLELRAGGAKDKALRNLALRTGVEDIDALVAMLIQAERFGTSIASSLRVQSDTLRLKRRQRAEETAAKIGLKLLFPLIFFIFPALLVVLMGPAFIQVTRALLPAVGAQ